MNPWILFHLGIRKIFKYIGIEKKSSQKILKNYQKNYPKKYVKKKKSGVFFFFFFFTRYTVPNW